MILASFGRPTILQTCSFLFHLFLNWLASSQGKNSAGVLINIYQHRMPSHLSARCCWAACGTARTHRGGSGS